MSTHTCEDRCRTIKKHWPDSYARLSEVRFEGPRASEHYRHIRKTMVFPDAMMAHITDAGDRMMLDPNTCHSSRIAESKNPDQPGLVLEFRSTQWSPDGMMERTVITPFWSHEPDHWVEPKLPRFFLENSLFFDEGT
jgi:hypothetical protein